MDEDFSPIFSFVWLRIAESNKLDKEGISGWFGYERLRRKKKKKVGFDECLAKRHVACMLGQHKIERQKKKSTTCSNKTSKLTTYISPHKWRFLMWSWGSWSWLTTLSPTPPRVHQTVPNHEVLRGNFFQTVSLPSS